VQITRAGFDNVFGEITDSVSMVKVHPLAPHHPKFLLVDQINPIARETRAWRNSIARNGVGFLKHKRTTDDCDSYYYRRYRHNISIQVIVPGTTRREQAICVTLSPQFSQSHIYIPAISFISSANVASHALSNLSAALRTLFKLKTIKQCPRKPHLANHPE
jgi:hypothetical protein